MATATSAWSKPGAWALESENLASAAIENLNLSSPNPDDPSPDFPSLASAAASKPSKKKKPQSQSLAEFNAGKIEILSLPTGPRERSAAELERSSRGFGYSAAPRVDELRRNSLSRDSGPSRADEVEDWGSVKRSAAVAERRFFDSQSRADEAERWVSKRGGEKRVGFEMFNRERSADSDNWGRKREEVSGGGRPRLVLQARTRPLMNGNMDGNGGEGNQGERNSGIVSSKGSSPFGLARPREEVLAEKGRDWKKIDEKLEPVKMKERVPDEGRKGPEDRTERSWRKDVASHALPSMSGFLFLVYLKFFC